MRFVSYKSTPGLENFAKNQQFDVYMSAHRRLLGKDPAYASAVSRYQLRIILVTICLMLFLFVACKSLAIGFFISAVCAAYTLQLAFTQQEFRNKTIGKELVEGQSSSMVRAEK
jgi:hypothetical protein